MRQWLIPPAYAKAYVRRNKNDAANASAFSPQTWSVAAIVGPVSRPAMRFAAVKSEDRQAAAGVGKRRYGASGEDKAPSSL